MTTNAPACLAARLSDCPHLTGWRAGGGGAGEGKEGRNSQGARRKARIGSGVGSVGAVQGNEIFKFWSSRFVPSLPFPLSVSVSVSITPERRPWPPDKTGLDRTQPGPDNHPPPQHHHHRIQPNTPCETGCRFALALPLHNNITNSCISISNFNDDVLLSRLSCTALYSFDLETLI